MGTIADNIKEIEAEILKTQKNKATEFHIGKLKAKIAALKAQAEKQASQGGGAGLSFAVKKSGNATVGLVGLPSVGKSTILNALTGQETSAMAAYEFTTLTVIPGMLHHRGADIQILDMPGIIAGAHLNKGRGREVIAAARNSDMILVTLDCTKARDHLPIIIRELEQSAIRINRRPKDIAVHFTQRGGIKVFCTKKQTHMSDEQIAELVAQFKVNNADVVVREDITPEDLVDRLAGNRVYISAVCLVNKVDLAGEEAYRDIERWLAEQDFPAIPLAASKNWGIEKAKDFIFENLHFIKVFLKPRGKEADMKEPLIVKSGTDIGMVCDLLHREFRRKFRYAFVWGKSAKFPGQTVGIDHKMLDGDILTIITRQ
ncbi:MAG TPA: GTP-binding protein [Candidatus Thermoplasmatota archaeon]|nr:GTP-binding protein [Candidatus Thermoplasmatota archaeon]